jgi:L-ascorbate metabolism protein UlaG (beta-lactamase superfamily)
MKLRLIRHATLWLSYAGLNFLIDPMLSEAGANPPIAGSANERRNPLVPLPVAIDELREPDAVMVTHLHRDHWDDEAKAALDKTTPVFCQPGDEEEFISCGFRRVTAVEASAVFQGVTMTRTGGRHGTGEIGQKMGRVSGFIFKAHGHPTVYLAGDTIWCDEVTEALDAYRPEVTIVNAGGARFLAGDPITMDAENVISLCRYAPDTRVVAVHMDAINHCLVTREQLRSRLAAENLLNRVALPADGSWL